ncbi:MAG: hypothetical protein ACJARU_001204 [Congregibacter sp.]
MYTLGPSPWLSVISFELVTTQLLSKNNEKPTQRTCPMNQALSTSTKLALGVTVLFGLLYLSFGLAWLAAPSTIAAALGASLLQGTGLTTQLGDSAAFFLCAGGFMLYGVFRRQPDYLMAGALMIGVVAPARLVAWQFHGAALTVEPMVVEILTFLAVFWASRALRSD